MKKRNWLILIIVICVAIPLVILFGASEFFLEYALSRNPYRMSTADRFIMIKDNYPWTSQWIDSIADNECINDTIINNNEGEHLNGYYIYGNTDTNRTALLIHGYKDSALGMLHIAYIYNKVLGMNVLLPDLHAHGLSDGKYIQMGWKDRLDIIRWIDMSKGIFGKDTKIIVHGISMGGATTMMLSGEENLSDNVKAFVDDCGYTSVWDEFEGEMYKQFRLPAFPLLYTTSLLCDIQNGWSFKEASSLNQVKKCNRPMLFIHGDNDSYVPTSMVHPLYKSATSPKELWLAPNSTHASSYKDHSEEYTKKVKEFCNKWLR